MYKFVTFRFFRESATDYVVLPVSHCQLESDLRLDSILNLFLVKLVTLKTSYKKENDKTILKL